MHFQSRLRGRPPKPRFISFVERAVSFPVPCRSPFPITGREALLLAVGAELKNTLCLTRDDLAFVSQHIGDLKNPETFAFFGEMAEHLAGLLEVSPAGCGLRQAP